MRVAGVVLLVAVFLGCGDSTSSSPTSPSEPGPTVGAVLSTGCEPRPGGPGGPVADPAGPFFHQAAIADTADGLTVTNPRQVLEHASVPDGVRRADGSLLIYYVNGADGGVWVARLSGDAATPIGPIAINGVSRPAGVVDPDATSLPDGRIRLAYLNGFGPPSSTSDRAMCLADSSDGSNFQVVGAAIRFGAGDTSTDPSIVQLRDGSWLMAISQGQRTMLARSGDGLTFSAYDTVSFGGVPELALTSDGRVRLYVCANGIQAYASGDAGRSWQPEGVVVPGGTLGRRIICDPSMVAGTSFFVFKTAN